jgi:hypothetical protein
MRPDLHPRHHLADSADHDDHLTRLVASAQTHILACSSISELQAMQSILTELDNDTHGAIMALLQKKSNTEEAGASFSDMDFEAGASSTQKSAVHIGVCTNVQINVCKCKHACVIGHGCLFEIEG